MSTRSEATSSLQTENDSEMSDHHEHGGHGSTGHIFKIVVP